ncbi:hypothetical protein [Vibrio vulnificus]|uniref:hypothetical protein n=1 Tax=Vibrio vulnificus TaxID=672 RepID=UPI0013EE8AA3|nr:hypothetical protein [Vibrio vulnificus]EHZ2651896.1 hypothetical protein [Vibrio vulnificus]MCU8194310.1 hypothetical protein [Vibrio vulnificus]HDY7776778.1 hypothetical protein [Vibrio vulnificus]
MNRHLLVALILCGSAAAQAKDFGNKGATFPVSEPSALQTFMDELHRAEKDGRIDAANREFEQKVKERVARPKVVNHLEPAREYRSFLVDMSKPLEQDVSMDGKLYPKGTMFNPLAKRIINRHLVVIDGDRAEEVDYAVAYLKEHGPNVKIVLWRGPIQELRAKHKVDFYFAQSTQIIDSFRMQFTPSVTYQDGLFMRVEEIPL